MRSSILIVIGALGLGCGGRQDTTPTPTPQTTAESGAEGVSPPPMAGQEIQGQEQVPCPETQPQDTQGQAGQGQVFPPCPEPEAVSQAPGQDMQGQDMQGQTPAQDMLGQTPEQGMPGQTPGQDMQGMHDDHGQAGGAAEHDIAAICPMEVQGTTARTQNVKGGVAIVFATRTGDVAELRRRVAQMAEMHNLHHAQAQAAPAESQEGEQPGVQEGAQPGAQEGAQGKKAVIPAQALAEDTDRGARLVLTPENPRQLKQVRQQIRKHAQEMASSGQCSMWEPQAMSETPAQRRARQASRQPRQR